MSPKGNSYEGPRPTVGTPVTTNANTHLSTAPSEFGRPAGPFAIGRLAAVAALAALSVILTCEAPLAPAVCGSLPQQTITVGESASVTACFDDPGGNTLSYKVWSSDPGVIAVAGSGATVTVRAVSPGSALVTVLADNNYGLKAQQSMRVLVPNRPPLAIGAIENREVIVGDSATVDVSGYFSEPDGQGLTYAAAADSSVLSASVEGTVLTVVAIAKGTATVTLTAMDPGGMKAVQSFVVLVPNRPPLPEGSVPGQTVEVADSATVDISPFFNDPDGDALSYSVVVSDTLVAAASVAESMITVAAVAKGQATITVTATDTEGLTAAQSFAVMVPNRPPLVMDTIAAQVVKVGNTGDLDMTPFFSDPDGDPLTYTAVSADRDIAWASVVESSVSVLAVAKGETTITVTATDTEGLAVAQDFPVTVPNQTPLPRGSIPAQTVRVDSVFKVDATPYFSDPDGDALTFVAASSDSTVATATAAGQTVTVTAVAKGQATVTVTVTDTEGLVATQTFAVTVPNRTPVATADIEAQRLEERKTLLVDLAPYFSDPDGDVLIFEAVSSAERVVTVTVVDGELEVTARRPGAATITVTARDSEGLRATLEFDVRVTRSEPNDPPVVKNNFASQSIVPGEDFSTDLDDHFDDPDDDPLTFGASSSNERVVTADISGHMLMLKAVDVGTANVRVTARDPQGGSASTQFQVVVDRSGGANRPPVVAARIPDQHVAPGNSFSADLRNHFSDPDREALSFDAESANESTASAAVSSSTLTVTGVANGTTSVTVTASDPGDRSATLTFSVTVETQGSGNRRPIVSRVISFVELDPGDAFETDLNGHFSDPDNDELTFGASSSNERVATADISGHMLMLKAVDEGTANVTVTARDPQGESASTQVQVVVDRSGGANRPPVVTARIPDQHVAPGNSFSADLRNHFSDPDREALSFDAESANESTASAAVSSSTLTVTGVANGTTSVTVTASDPGDRSATLTFSVTVETQGSGNRRPIVSRVISSVELDPDYTFDTDLTGHFSDPDNDELTFGASSSNDAVASAGVSGRYLIVTAVATGTATISVSAEDPGSLSTGFSFDVTVKAPTTGNRAPILTSLPPNRVIVQGRALPVQGWRYFDDPDGDELTYSGSSSDPTVATIDQRSEIYFEVFAKSDGSATITITARDPGGLTNSTSFIFTVGNNAPTVIAQVPDLTSSPGQVDTVKMSRHFRDGDGGDQLTLRTSSSNTNVVATSAGFSGLFGHYASIRGVAVGQATVTMTATDLGGLSVSQSFVVTVDSNRPPRVTSTIDSILKVEVGDTLSYVLSEYFSDPDGDDLTYSARVGFFASVAVEGDTLHIIGTSVGISPGTVTATDTGGKSASLTWIVRVLEPVSSRDMDHGAGFAHAPGATKRVGGYAGVAVAVRWRRRAGRSSGIVPAQGNRLGRSCVAPGAGVPNEP